MDSTRTDTPPERLYNLEHLSPEFLHYLNVLVGNVIATGGFGKIEIEIARGKIDRVWVGTSGKAGYQF